MYVPSLTAPSKYDHKTLINNPPYITNYPWLDYVQDKKLGFKYAKLSTGKELFEREQNRETFMSGLLFATLAAGGGFGYYLNRKIKNFLRR